MKKLSAILMLLTLLASCVGALAAPIDGETMYATQAYFMLKEDDMGVRYGVYNCAVVDIGDSDKTYFAVNTRDLDALFKTHDTTPLIAMTKADVEENNKQTYPISEVIREDGNPLALLVSYTKHDNIVKAKIADEVKYEETVYNCAEKVPAWVFNEVMIGKGIDSNDDGERYELRETTTKLDQSSITLYNADGEFVGMSYDTTKLYFAGSLEKLVKSAWTLYLIIAAGAVVLAAIVVFIIKLTGKGKTQQPKAEPEKPKQPKIVAFCNTGDMAGNEFSVGTQLTIGRDPARCDVVYPQNAPGVSGLHCRLTPMADGSVMLTDMGSSYGTFAGGEKLVPHVGRVMFDGETFELGDARNTYTIRISG